MITTCRQSGSSRAQPYGRSSLTGNEGAAGMHTMSASYPRGILVPGPCANSCSVFITATTTHVSSGAASVKSLGLHQALVAIPRSVTGCS